MVFSRDEYEARWASVYAEMRRRGYETAVLWQRSGGGYDRAGNVWYLGENTTEYENGKPVSTAGSFEAGVDGAEAGVIMPAHPRTGMCYRQEYYKGHAEDRARIVSRHEQAGVPFGHFDDVLETREDNPLEPRALEFKFYARGVGPVLAVSVSGGSDREELLRYRRGR